MVRYDSAATDLIVLPGSGKIRLIGLVKTDDQMNGIPKIADLTFTGLFSTSVDMIPSEIIMADKSGKIIPVKASVPSCAAVVLGDVNNDCSVDVSDAALVQTYAREMRTNFASAIGRAIYSELSATQKARMDVDTNGVADSYDGRFLLDAIAGYTKLIESFVVSPPTAPSCDLKITAVLKNEDQTAAINTRAFAVFTYPDSTLNAELTSSGMLGSVSFELSSGSCKHGRAFEMTKSTNGTFILTGVKPKITKNNVGLTLVIVTTTSSAGSKVSSSFVKPANITGSKKTVYFVAGIAIDVYDSFRPQVTANFSSPNSLCNGNTVSKRLQMRFKAEFSLIVGKEAKFVAEFKTFFEAKYSTRTRQVVAANISVTAGSIVVDFDVTILKSQETQFINDVKNDVKDGLSFNFESNTLTTAQTLKVDGEEKIPPPQTAKSDKKILIIVIVVVVVFFLLFIGIVALICYRKKRMGSKKIQAIVTKQEPNGNFFHAFPL